MRSHLIFWRRSLISYHGSNYHLKNDYFQQVEHWQLREGRFIKDEGAHFSMGSSRQSQLCVCPGHTKDDDAPWSKDDYDAIACVSTRDWQAAQLCECASSWDIEFGPPSFIGLNSAINFSLYELNSYSNMNDRKTRTIVHCLEQIEVSKTEQFDPWKKTEKVGPLDPRRVFLGNRCGK